MSQKSNALTKLLAALLVALLANFVTAQTPAWPTYGGDPGGQRFSTSTQITAGNISQLTPAWTFHTGALSKGRPGTAGASFEATPILFHGALFLSSPFDEVLALDPATGAPLWTFDPHLPDVSDSGILTSRGVAAWPLATSDEPLPADKPPCTARIFIATMDARLLALDAATGHLCTGFGASGQINLTQNVRYQKNDPYFITSPPTVIGDLVIVGSGIGDNLRVDSPSGLIRAFDARTGRLAWQYEPLPWAAQQRHPTGAGNAWSVIAADPAHNLIFIPTGAPSPDFFGGHRPGDNRDANSVVALEASTGRRVWAFQVVHHDLWDYDIAAEPLLFTFHGISGSEATPAVAITTKQGLVFLLNRLTGAPLFPILERPVPASNIPGETASPTQPFQQIDALSPLTLDANTPLGLTPADNLDCRAQIARLRYEGIYTPPSLGGTLAFPGSLGGVNWGGAALDPTTNTLIANTNRYAFAITLVPHQPLLTRLLLPLVSDERSMVRTFTLLAVALLLSAFMLVRCSRNPGPIALAIAALFILGGSIAYFQFPAPKPLPAHHRTPPPQDPLIANLPATALPSPTVEHFGHEFSPQDGTPYAIRRKPLIAASGSPCTAQPFGAVSALNLDTGKAAWQTPLGTLIPGQHTGTLSLGGILITATGLAFTAASTEPLFRAFDTHTGAELWSTPLPVPAQATPMTYTWQGRQYIVLAAGGHGAFGTPQGDTVIAFALPQHPR